VLFGRTLAAPGPQGLEQGRVCGFDGERLAAAALARPARAASRQRLSALAGAWRTETRRSPR
jgi:hypothetical protein